MMSDEKIASDLGYCGGPVGGAHLQLIPWLCPRFTDDAGREFEHRVGAQTGGNPPGSYGIPDLFNAQRAIHVDEIERESHPEGMNGLAWDDPKAAAGRECVAPEEPFGTLRTGTGNLKACCEGCVPGCVDELLWIFKRCSDWAAQGFAQAIHHSIKDRRIHVSPFVRSRSGRCRIRRVPSCCKTASLKE